jgi:hypothetical protein
MKSKLAVLALSVLAIAAPAFAQSTNLRAEIPFDFVVGKAVMPAGEYLVQSQTNPAILVIRNTGGQGAMVVAHYARSNKAAANSKLVFRGYDGEYFLSQIWTEGDESGRELTITKRERKLAEGHPPLQRTVLAQMLGGK